MTQLELSKWSKQTSLQRHTSGQSEHEKNLNIIYHQANVVLKHNRDHAVVAQMATIREDSLDKDMEKLWLPYTAGGN